MNKIQCLLVDDEPPAIELLLNYCNMIDQLHVVGTSHSAVKAFDMLKTHSIDLIFLDIQMPVLNGIDFIKTLQNPPAVILTTAYREYALDGYDLNIIDYLLKPISFDRFLKAVDRYRERSSKILAAPSKQQDIQEYIFCNINKTQHKIILDEILFIESLKDYVRVHLKNEKLIIKGNLGSFMNKLQNNKIVRIHRSFAININRIHSYSHSEVRIAEHNIPIGSSHKNQLFTILNAK